MNSRGKLTNEFDEGSDLVDSNRQPFSELDSDIPIRSPIRRKDRQREGGVQKKHKRSEKRKISRLKNEYEL